MVEAGVIIVLAVGLVLIKKENTWSKISYLHFGLFGLILNSINIYTWGWTQLINWEIIHGGVWNFSALFASLQWNDLSFLQGISPWWITSGLRFCYNGGYLCMILIPAVPCFVRGDFLQGWRYVLSGHILQSILIIPLLLLFSVQEIWWVKHIPDGLNRNFTNGIDMLKTSYNCFPSMHTSMAAAMLIVGLKEKDQYFKFGWSLYCLLVILSTVYFPIHWVLDVIAGILFGWISSKVGCSLAEKVMSLINYIWGKKNKIVKEF